MNPLSLRNNRLKFKTSRELPVIWEESIEEYTSNEWKQNRKIMSTCNRLDLESLGSWPIVYIWPKTSRSTSHFNLPNLKNISQKVLNYRVMVEGYPNLKEEVGGLNPGCEISSLLDGKLARWWTASCALALAYQPFVSKIKKKRKNISQKDEKGTKRSQHVI